MDELNFVEITEVDEDLIEKVRCWRNRDGVRCYMLNQQIIKQKEHINWIVNLENNYRIKVWIVFYNYMPVGIVNLQNIDYNSLSSEWGFYIGEDKYRGKGLGKCILFKLLNIFFEEMKFNVLITKVLNNNIPALKIYKKFHFKEINKIVEQDKEIIILNFSKEDWIIWREVIKNECKYQNIR